MPKKKQPKAENTMQQFVEPKSSLSTEVFRKSDRLQMALAGKRNRVGASCNVYACEDSIESIAKAHSWALHVCHQQGAPSIYYGNLRPRGSNISTGGVSGGAVPFMHMFDSLVHNIKRDTYKKGAGIAWLSSDHPDLQEFLSADFQSIYRGVLLPIDLHEVPDATFALLAEAYDAGKCFLCKTPAPAADGTPRYLNLCTEVEIVSGDMCILGVVNLSQYDTSNIATLPVDFTNAALEMVVDARTAYDIKRNSPLQSASDEFQFGLGISGLASLLANCGVSYASFVNLLSLVINNSHPTIQSICRVALEVDNTHNTTVSLLVSAVCQAYAAATLALQGTGVQRAFCVQPSATGAYECADVSGYHSSPELQPVIGLRDSSGVHTIRKSQLLGDQKVVFHPATETIEEVPYATYARLCSAWQVLLNSTGLAHRHSACWYGKKFGVEDLVRFLGSPQLSLYYRLPYYNPEALDKTNVGEGLEVDFDLESLCPLQQAGDSDCGCAG